jgi:hypothetical protein
VIKKPLDADRVPVGAQRFERLRATASKLRTTLTQDVATRVKTRHPTPLLPRARRSVRRLLRRPDPMKLTVRCGWLWGEDERECYSVLVEERHGIS